MVGAHLGLECVQGRVMPSCLRAQLSLPGASRGRPSAQEGSGERYATRSRRGLRDLGNLAALNGMRSLSLDFDSVPTPQAPRAGAPSRRMRALPARCILGVVVFAGHGRGRSSECTAIGYRLGRVAYAHALCASQRRVGAPPRSLPRCASAIGGGVGPRGHSCPRIGRAWWGRARACT